MPGAPLDFGKGKLIDNSARLLDYAGHHAALLTRYVRMTVHLAARGLHAPPGLDETALAAWLDRVGKARGTAGSCLDILNNLDRPSSGKRRNAAENRDSGRVAGLFASALAIYNWKGEILHGSSATRRSGQRHPQ
jgi:hypothetical protein